MPVDHVGSVSSSREEAARVAALIASMRGGSWTSDKAVTAPLRAVGRLAKSALSGRPTLKHGDFRSP